MQYIYLVLIIKYIQLANLQQFNNYKIEEIHKLCQKANKLDLDNAFIFQQKKNMTLQYAIKLSSLGRQGE